MMTALVVCYDAGAKFTKHCKTNFRQCYNIQQVYHRFTIKHDLQKNVQESTTT